jgi:hypothetical protein
MHRLLRFLVVALLSATLLPAVPAAAASCSWTGATSNDWNTATNWSCGRVPEAADDVTIDVSGANISLTMNATINSLLIKRGSITGNGALNVANLTTLDVFSDTTLSTNGSRFPQVAILAQDATVRLTDPALSADSLQTLSLSGGTTVLQVGNRQMNSLVVAKHPISQNGGNLMWSGALTVSQSLNWTSGGGLFKDPASSLPARLTIAATAPVAAAILGTINGVTFVNESSLAFNATFFPQLGGSPGAKFVNNGTLELNPSITMAINGNGDLINNGTLRKLGANPVNVSLGIPFTNNGLFEITGGRIRFSDMYTQNAGELRLNGGGLAGNSQFAQLNLVGGTISGTGVITSSVLNFGGTLAPTGTLKILGSYTHGPTATLKLNIAGKTPGTDFGVLQIVANQNIGGRATIQGGQVIVNRVGNFQPNVGDRFPIATCSDSCNGSFAKTSGNLSPAFAGFAANKEIVVAEPAAAVLLSVKPEKATLRRDETNGYTVKLLNLTGAAANVSNLVLTLPISLTYVANSTSGALSNNPTETPNPGTATRQLRWNGPIALAAGATSELRFRVAFAPGAPIGSYALDVQLLVGSATVSYNDLAPISLPLDAARNLSVIGANQLITTTDPPIAMLSRSRGLTISTRIICPFTDCGALLNVYIEHSGQLFTMSKQPTLQTSRAVLQNNDYGFWDGYISPPSVFPGEPTKIFPDWENYRACIFYDYGGGGGRPQGCVPGGDNGPTPQLFDPSGVISDANTGQPVVGATVTLFRVRSALPDTPTQTRDCRTIPTRGGNVWSGTAPNTGVFEEPSLLPKQIDPQVNPQVTGSDGRYGWNVVTGCWYVQVSAPGYQSKISALVGVPPEVTDLDITLVPDPTAKRFVFLPLTVR